MNRTVPTLAAALAATVLAACGHGNEKAKLPEAAPAGRAVRVSKPAVRMETGLARSTGTVRAKEEAVLSAKASGQIHKVLVSVGDRVRAGSPLVEMDAVNARINLENAQAAERLAAANLAAADREVARSKMLFEAQSLPEAGFDRVKTAREVAAAQLDQARAALSAAKQMLADTVITAPFAGVVTAKFHNAGDTVTLMPVTPIVTVTDVDHLELRLAAPEAIESFVRPGQVIEAVLTPSGQRFKAKVRVKGSVVDPQSRTIEVIADVLPGTGPAIRPGALANVDFGGFGEKDGLYLPAGAVRTDANGAHVLLAAAGKAELRPVQVSPLNPGTVLVTGGLAPDALVILDPGALRPGDPVVAVAAEEAK
ncbi:MAG TPA: efflux RND transporter periplasmic adaptor subunit [Anaeromyxobacteraceae bacterium]|nr:efflux RND transporter periplasmic adaptor subunit [Anaeromyxobacteraceae bacterium]